jgi:hypothetical protein
MSEFAKIHRTYFESDAGKELLSSLNVTIDDLHKKAEQAADRDLSFAFTQRAKGAREVLDIINSMTATRKQPM